MFDVRTPKRIYYLAADSEDEMMKWVHNVCHVCGLKAYSDDDGLYLWIFDRNLTNTRFVLIQLIQNFSVSAFISVPGEEEPSTPTTVITEPDLESPPVSPSSTTSPYIPIFECRTGPPLTSTSGLTHPTQVYRASQQFHRLPHLLPVKRSEPLTNNNVSASSSGPSAALPISDEFYDLPRQLRPPAPQALDLISGDGRSMPGEWEAQKVMEFLKKFFFESMWSFHVLFYF